MPDITPLSIIEPATIDVEGRHDHWQANTDKRRTKITGADFKVYKGQMTYTQLA